MPPTLTETPSPPRALPLQGRTARLAVTTPPDEMPPADGSDIQVSFSSATPVNRWWGDEVLLHGVDNVNLSFAADGLPLLLNHDTCEVVGLIEDVQLDGDRLIGVVRFSSSPEAQQIRRDVLDGIRKNMSVGYRIDAMREVPKPGAEADPVTGRVATQWEIERWTPMEGSLVPIPADITVGVGRADDPGAFAVRSIPLGDADTAKEHKRMPEIAIPPVKAAVGDPPPEGKAPDMKAERQRVNDLHLIGKTYDLADRAAEWITQGRTVEEVKLEIFEEVVKRSQAGKQPGHIDLSPAESKQYSITRAIANMHTGEWSRTNSFEREISDTIAPKVAARIGRSIAQNGFLIPLNLMVPGELSGPQRDFSVMQRAALTGNVAGTSSLGGFAVATEIMPFIELLRNRMMTRKLGARVLTGLTSNIAFPRQITANTLTWAGENPSTPLANTALTLNQLVLTPKTAMMGTAFSRQAAFQSSPSLDAMVMSDLATGFAIGFDLAGVNGQGTLEPTGILMTSGVNVRALGTNGAALAWADIVGLETDVAIGNADFGSLGYLTTPGVRGKMKTTLKSTTAGAAYLWEGGVDDGQVNGYPGRASNQVPSNLTKGTSTTVASAMIFGNWEELLYAEFGGAVELLVDPYTAANQGMIQIHGIGFLDVGVRHTASFSVIKDILTT